MNRIINFPFKNATFTDSAENRIQNRSRVVAFRITERDYEYLAIAARREGKTVGNLISSLAFSFSQQYRHCQNCRSRSREV